MHNKKDLLHLPLVAEADFIDVDGCEPMHELLDVTGLNKAPQPMNVLGLFIILCTRKKVEHDLEEVH